MPTATLTSKGQLTLPAKIRHELGLKAGDRINFVLNETTNRYEMRPATGSIDDLYGIFHKPGRHLTIEEMNEAIAEAGASAGKIYK